MHANMAQKIKNNNAKTESLKNHKTFALTVKNIVQQTCAQKECELH